MKTANNITMLDQIRNCGNMMFAIESRIINIMRVHEGSLIFNIFNKGNLSRFIPPTTNVDIPEIINQIKVAITLLQTGSFQNAKVEFGIFILLS